jgi:hypothetical protein
MLPKNKHILHVKLPRFNVEKILLSEPLHFPKDCRTAIAPSVWKLDVVDRTGL